MGQIHTKFAGGWGWGWGWGGVGVGGAMGMAVEWRRGGRSGHHDGRMAKTATASNQLRKGDKVVATADLRAVPEGTAGKVIVVNGFTWIRYWVRFENGEVLGSISRDKLATKQDLLDEANGVGLASSDDASGDGGGEAAAADDTGGVTTANGTFVSQKHIDRAKAARARLTGV